MTGREHYAESEHMLDEAERADYGTDTERYCVNAAAAHALLAIAAELTSLREIYGGRGPV